MIRSASSRRPRRAQRGAVLVVGLIFLAMLTLIGVAAYSVATQEERMSSNSRDRTIALQAAEAGLRECESMVTKTGTTYSLTGGTDANGNPGGFYARLPSAAGLSWGDPGFTTPPPGGQLRFHTVPSAVPAGSSQQPAQCLAETYTADSGAITAAGVSQAQKPTTIYMARITAVGYGLNPNTKVTLQSNYLR